TILAREAFGERPASRSRRLCAPNWAFLQEPGRSPSNSTPGRVELSEGRGMREEISGFEGSGVGARNRRARAGFTMIEVSLALTVLVVALAATTASNLRMQSLRRNNHDRVAAQNAVQSITERVQAIGRAGTSHARSVSR